MDDLRQALRNINGHVKDAGRKIKNLSRRTVAGLFGDIDGVSIELLAHSGTTSLPGTVPAPRGGLKLPTDGSGIGDVDAERKIFEYLDDYLTKNSTVPASQVSGRVRLIIDHRYRGGGACGSCTKMIEAFRGKWPGIHLEVEP